MSQTRYATCTHPGCTETAFWMFDNQREAHEHLATRMKWKCIRHANVGATLNQETPTKEWSSTSKIGEGCGGHKFWDGMGFIFGPGFQAFCDDFPEGTKLTVRATVEFPTKP